MSAAPLGLGRVEGLRFLPSCRPPREGHGGARASRAAAASRSLASAPGVPRGCLSPRGGCGCDSGAAAHACRRRSLAAPGGGGLWENPRGAGVCGERGAHALARKAAASGPPALLGSAPCPSGWVSLWLSGRLGNFLWELYPKYSPCAISQEGSGGLSRLSQSCVCADLLDEWHRFTKRCEAGS